MRKTTYASPFLFLHTVGPAASQQVMPDIFMRAFGPYERPVYAGLHFTRDAAGRITHFILSTPAGEDAAQGLVSRRVERGGQP